MKSVRSPVHPGGARRGRFQLQQNHAPINVYSQLPHHEEDESQYQEDSFCVGSEEEGYLFVCVCVGILSVCLFIFMFTVCKHICIHVHNMHVCIHVHSVCVCVCVCFTYVHCVCTSVHNVYVCVHAN